MGDFKATVSGFSHVQFPSSTLPPFRTRKTRTMCGRALQRASFFVDATPRMSCAYGPTTFSVLRKRSNVLLGSRFADRQQRTLYSNPFRSKAASSTVVAFQRPTNPQQVLLASGATCVVTRRVFLPASRAWTADAAGWGRHDIPHPVQEVDVQPSACRSRVQPLRLAVGFRAAGRPAHCRRSGVHLVHLLVSACV